jgi:mycoredoxin
MSSPTQPPGNDSSPGLSDAQIAVYGTRGCAHTQKVRRHLDQRGISYVYRDMETDLAAARQVHWWTGGSFSHPTVWIGGQILVEPDLDELDGTLARFGIL